MTVRGQTNLVKRGSTYYFRKKIPQELRDHYGRESIRKSLREFTSQAEAKREASRLAEHYEAEFEAIRRSRSAPAVPLTRELVPRLVSSFEAATLAADDAVRSRGMDERTFEDTRAAIAEQLTLNRGAFARGDVSAIREAMLGWLDASGVDLGSDREAQHQLARGLLEGRIRALKVITQRLEGEPVATPDSPNAEAIRAAYDADEPERAEEALARAVSVRPDVEPALRKGHRLSNVIDYWKGASKPTPRTASTADSVVREFTELHGDIPLRDITKGHFVELRDKLQTRVKPQTVQTRFNLIKAAFTVCLEDDQLGITANPLQYVKVRGAEETEKARDAYTVDQLQALFDSPVFTERVRPVGGRGETAFWVPLIALNTGARLDEIVSLRTDGLYQHEGVWVLHFRHRPESGQQLKGRAKNNRRVPVHAELLRLGLVQYLRGVEKRGPWLFPDIDRSEKRRSHSSAWGAWFGRYLRRLGIKTADDKLGPSHSFRHTLKHFARASGVPEDHHDAMTGHITGEVARRYGSCDGYPVGALAGSMKQLQFGKLDLSRVKGLP